MKILLFGKTGQLGWELQQTLAPLGEVIAFDSAQLDLVKLQAVRDIINRIKPQIIVNAAGYTSVDLAEKQQELAMLLNAHLPRVLAETANDNGAVLIHYSTDYVFDGMKGIPYNESDETHPINFYGQSKLAGEEAIVRTGCIGIILRTSWMYSLRGVNFVTKTLSWAREQETLRIVTDQIGSPTWARMLANLTASMIVRSFPYVNNYFFDKSGIYHVGGSGSVSRYDFARAILNLDPKLEEQTTKSIEPALTIEFPTPAKRPLATPLDCSYFEHVFGLYVPDWEVELHLAMGSNDLGVFQMS